METDIYRRLREAGHDDIIAEIIRLETRQNALKAEIGDRDLKIEQLQKSLRNITAPRDKPKVDRARTPSSFSPFYETISWKGQGE